MQVKSFRNPATLQTLMEIIAAQCSSETLADLQVISEFAVPIALDHLRPLSRHRRLKMLHLGASDGTANIEDVGWHEIAQ